MLKKAELLPTALLQRLVSDVDIENIDTWSTKNSLIHIDTKRLRKTTSTIVLTI